LNALSSEDYTGREELWVLFVDDDSMQLIMLKPLLESLDPLIHIDTLSDPIRAVQRIRNFDYDCVVSEYIVGGRHEMNIFKAVKNIKPIPTVLYTSRDYIEVQRMAELSDVNGYIQKNRDPESYPTLIRFIRDTVKKYRAKNPNREYRNDPMTTWQTKKRNFVGITRDVIHGT
jgi:DNA-binding NtrC family response regulator